MGSGISRFTAASTTQAGRTAEPRHREFRLPLGIVLVHWNGPLGQHFILEIGRSSAWIVVERLQTRSTLTFGLTTVASSRTPLKAWAGRGSKGQGTGRK